MLGIKEVSLTDDRRLNQNSRTVKGNQKFKKSKIFLIETVVIEI